MSYQEYQNLAKRRSETGKRPSQQESVTRKDACTNNKGENMIIFIINIATKVTGDMYMYHAINMYM